MVYIVPKGYTVTKSTILAIFENVASNIHMNLKNIGTVFQASTSHLADFTLLHILQYFTLLP